VGLTAMKPGFITLLTTAIILSPSL